MDAEFLGINVGREGKYLTIGSLGALAEHQVIVDLMERGYEVFKACNPNAPYDLLIDREGEFRRIEVKCNSGGGSKKYKHRADVLAVVRGRTEIEYTPTLEEGVRRRGVNVDNVREARRRKKAERERERMEMDWMECVELRKQGMTISEISMKTGLKVPLVSYRLARYEEFNPQDRLPREKRGRQVAEKCRAEGYLERCREMIKQGYNGREISEELGVGRGTVSREARKLDEEMAGRDGIG